MIPEPQRTYLLELLDALGPAANEFVIAGAQAMKFVIREARATKDIDLILDVVRLRAEPLQLGKVLRRLSYKVIEEARNFQFEKRIPDSPEIMRIEFMAPEEFGRERDFRVDVQDGVHARSCTGGKIALTESDTHTLAGNLPNGESFVGNVRVTRPHSLVMLKLLALAGRYSNIRGLREARHDREEAQTHAADIVAVVMAQTDPLEFKRWFESQFESDPGLGLRVLRIARGFFGEAIAPGFLVYEEYLAASAPLDSDTRRKLRQETEKASRVMSQVLPSPGFHVLADALEDSCDWARNPGLVEEFLSGLEQRRTTMNTGDALLLLPGAAFGGAYKPGENFVTGASDAVRRITSAERGLLHARLRDYAKDLEKNDDLRKRFRYALGAHR